MDSTTLLSLLGSKATVSLVIIYLINWFKQSKYFPIINYESAKLNHFISVLLTGIGTLGIHATFNSQSHALLITGLAWSTVLAGAWNWVQTYIITKVGYTVLKDKLMPSPMGIAQQMKATPSTTIQVKG